MVRVVCQETLRLIDVYFLIAWPIQVSRNKNMITLFSKHVLATRYYYKNYAYFSKKILEFLIITNGK